MPLQILMLYSHRFKIEVGFKQALHVLGSYAYHFLDARHDADPRAQR